MLDFKLCLLDLIRPSSCPKPKKSLKEMSYKYSSNFMQKYNDVNIIYFNENMSMARKYDMRKYSPNFSNFRTFETHSSSSTMTNENNNNLINKNKNYKLIRNCHNNKNKNRKFLREWGSESVSFEFSSDDREDKTESDDTTTDIISSDIDIQSEVLDSFCTLCTSSFSFNHCRYCDNSGCSSKCQSEKSINCGCGHDKSTTR